MSATLTEAAKVIRSFLAPLSPRHRRWQHFLHTLPLDPDELSLPLAAPGVRDFIICGSPRTGTTLLSGLLFQPPEIVTVMEPWDGMRVPPAELFTLLRREIVQSGTLRRGKLDVRALQATGSVKWQQEGASGVQLEVTNDFLLGVKWPSFWRYLPLLPETKFLVCLRHPYETIHSFKEVGGRLGQGLEYDTKFNRRMNDKLKAAKVGDHIRRILLYEYIHMHILPYLQGKNVFVVRYERWFTEPMVLLKELSDFLGAPLTMGHIAIRQSKRPSSITDEEKATIRAHCRSAQALGYRL